MSAARLRAISTSTRSEEGAFFVSWVKSESINTVSVFPMYVTSSSYTDLACRAVMWLPPGNQPTLLHTWSGEPHDKGNYLCVSCWFSYQKNYISHSKWYRICNHPSASVITVLLNNEITRRLKTSKFSYITDNSYQDNTVTLLSLLIMLCVLVWSANYFVSLWALSIKQFFRGGDGWGLIWLNRPWTKRVDVMYVPPPYGPIYTLQTHPATLCI